MMRRACQLAERESDAVSGNAVGQRFFLFVPHVAPIPWLAQGSPPSMRVEQTSAKPWYSCRTACRPHTEDTVRPAHSLVAMLLTFPPSPGGS